MATLFESITIRGITLPNRVVVSPLCMYSAVDGLAQPFHFAHLSTFARGRAGLVFTEATAVEAIGRITPNCLGLWNSAQVNALKPITAFIKEMGSVPGVQLSHAGRKASTSPPFAGAKPILPANKDSWTVVGPTDSPVADGFPIPHELSIPEIKKLVKSFVSAAERALEAGFEVLELHGAHGYLLHSFLSPISNIRDDEYGGNLAGRMKLPLEIAETVRKAIGEKTPLFFRISAIDGVDGGWTMDDSVALANNLGQRGVDVVDCSSGGITGAPRFRIDDAGKPLSKSSARAAGFQVPYAEQIRKDTSVMSMAVGVIIDPHQAQEIIKTGKADLVAIGREIMFNPFWPLHAAATLNVDPGFDMWPKQYKWAVDRREQIKTLNE